jgi:hypothetical protein
MLDERINAALDGDLPLTELTAAERAEVERIRAAAAGLRASLPAARPDLSRMVLSRIRELGLEYPRPAAGAPATPVRSPRRARLGMLWRPRQVSFGFRPAWGLAAALLAAVLAFPFGSMSRGGSAPDSTGGTALADATPPAEAPPVFVQFRLEAHGASDVVLAGSFTDWRPEHELVEIRPGVWTVLVALAPGVHDYAFLVDGEQWVADPAAPAIDDGFGGVNSRLALLPS